MWGVGDRTLLRDGVGFRWEPVILALLRSLCPRHFGPGPEEEVHRLSPGDDQETEDLETKPTEPPVVRVSFPKPEVVPPKVSSPVPTVEEPMADLDPEKRKTIWSILSVFETGKSEGDYGAVAVLQDGAGISFGKHQSTDGSDSLDAILLRYVDLGGSRSDDFRRLLPRLVSDESTALIPNKPETWPDWAIELVGLLRESGTDPVMRRAQDEVFAERYWNPCLDQCMAMKLVLPLSWCAVYDTTVQSGPSGIANIRKRFKQSPPSGGGDEKIWAKAYLEARRKWICEFHNPSHPERDATVRSTVYRADALLRLVEEGNWGLAVPIQIQKPKATVT